MSDYFLGNKFKREEDWFWNAVIGIIVATGIAIVLLGAWFSYTLTRDQALKNCTGSVEYCNKLSR